MSYLPNAGQIEFTFQDNASSAGTGNVLSVNSGMSVMKLEFATSGTFTAQIEAQLINQDKWYPYPSFKLPMYDLMSSTITDANYLYEVDLTGITKLRVNLTAVGGSTSVYSRAVS